jgi:hypothetical protein
MFAKAVFSKSVPTALGKQIVDTMSHRFQTFADEIGDSQQLVIRIISLTQTINRSILRTRAYQNRLNELNVYYPLLIDAINNTFTGENIDGYLLGETQRHILDRIADLLNRHEHSSIVQIAQNSTHLKNFMTTDEILMLSRIHRKIYNATIEILVTMLGDEQRTNIRKICNDLFEIDFGKPASINQFLTTHKVKLDISIDDWAFILELASLTFGVESLQSQIINQAAILKHFLVAQIDLGALLNSIVNLQNSRPEPLTIQRYFLDTFRKLPHAFIPGLTDLWGNILNRYVRPTERIRDINELINLSIETRIDLESRPKIEAAAINNFTKNLYHSILHAANLYDSRNINKGGILYYLYHGNKGKRRVAQLIELFNNIDLSATDKIHEIEQFLGYHQNKSGLRANSFDTRLMILFFNEAAPRGIFGRQSFNYLKDAPLNLPTPTTEESKQLSPQGLVPSLLRGENRFKSKRDRQVIRVHIRLMLFSIYNKLIQYNESKTQLANMPRLA